jgi:hypothetical protein
MGLHVTILRGYKTGTRNVSDKVILAETKQTFPGYRQRHTCNAISTAIVSLRNELSSKPNWRIMKNLEKGMTCI